MTGAAVARSGPPSYAWDWFARQRLPWREARSRLIAGGSPVAARYAAVEVRGEVLALLRTDYPRDAEVRDTVHAVVGEVVFLGRTTGRFADLGLRSAPRGMRWWWSALTGEDVDAGAAPTVPGPPAQLSLDEVHIGYGDAPGHG